MNRNHEIHIICQLKAQSEYREEVKRLLELYVNPAREEEGCLYYHVFQDRHDLDEFFILDGWKNMTAVNTHVVHHNVLKINVLIEPLLVGKQKLTWGQRISSLESMDKLM